MPVSLSAAAVPTFPSPERRILLTGASGFVGRAIARRLGEHDALSMGGEGWQRSLEAADFRGAAIIHLAARVHDPAGSDAAFEADNVDKTRRLAQAAARGGASRFVFASSVKVHGDESPGRPLRVDDPVHPPDAYARSKWRAEEALREVAAREGLATVIVRIPLTYGRGAGGNFRSLVRLADSGAWLPFAAIDNRRSLVHVDDLAAALHLAASHPSAPGRTLLVAHPEPVSTPRLVSAIRRALRRPARLFRFPPALLEGMAALAGQGGRIRRLTRSLEVDPGDLVRDLGWIPRFALQDGIAEALGDRGGAA